MARIYIDGYPVNQDLRSSYAQCGCQSTQSEPTHPANLLVVLFECNAYKSEEHMMIGDRLRDLREAKHLSQGDIEDRTGLLRCYVSRVENGHTVPAIETLEKWAHALEVPLYQFFYDGDEPPQVPTILRGSKQKGIRDWASRGKGLRMFIKMRRALSRMSAVDRSLLMHVARKVSHQSRGTENNRGR